MIKTLNKYYELGLLIKQTHPELPLIIWNYTDKVQYEGLWNDITLMCRGLITDTDGNIIARPFKKFFNIEENRHTPTEEFEVFEKMDGSLGIAFVYNDKIISATRGSFTSEQSIWMSKYLHKYNYQDILVSGYTYLFEIIYPSNQIVVNYNGQEKLVLLSIIETNTNIEVPYEDIDDGFELVSKYDGIIDYSILKNMVANNAEGFVVRFSNGSRMKIKGEEYIRLHKIMTNVSTRSVWEILKNNQPIDVLLHNVPDEFFYKIRDYVNDLTTQYTDIETTVNNEFNIINKQLGECDNKTFALAIQNHPFKSFLFSLRSGKDITEAIWKFIKPEYEKL